VLLSVSQLKESMQAHARLDVLIHVPNSPVLLKDLATAGGYCQASGAKAAAVYQVSEQRQPTPACKAAQEWSAGGGGGAMCRQCSWGVAVQCIGLLAAVQCRCLCNARVLRRYLLHM
jgi:hypothetical protein